jgi:hypothetical protein
MRLIPRPMPTAVLAYACLALFCGQARAQQPPPNCTPIQFPPGQTSTTIKGIVHAEEIICYRFAAANGQTANLKITGNNMMISVYDVGDARTSWTFKTKARTYSFIVAQMMRSISNEPFTLTLSVK